MARGERGTGFRTLTKPARDQRPDPVRRPQRQLFPEVDLQPVSGAVRIGVARCFTRSEQARVGERLRLEAPILLVGKGAGSDVRPPEIETRADIGRDAGREGVCKYVSISMVAGILHKKQVI